ncbi:MAG: phosphatidylglycerophosphatase A [Deltaproteobacteria bacterium]|jgi:phosphatidylglycerophosphatase A|nr:phosphatidylglycerophosphatase A [Deltaproteobacteria bacterium]MDL1988594.1 phosphatidylglycerophosphatase A [Deltaproteobacteria bacterium]
MNFREKSVMVLATGCFTGYIPFAPGTFGSIVGIPLCFLLSKTKLSVAILFILIFIFFAIWIANKAEKVLKQKDPGCIVIDEIAGIMIALLGLPFNTISVAAGFVTFRFFDILKPFPIRYIERRLAGGTGIVMDDLAAGVYSNIVLRLLFITSA